MKILGLLTTKPKKYTQAELNSMEIDFAKKVFQLFRKITYRNKVWHAYSDLTNGHCGNKKANILAEKVLDDYVRLGKSSSDPRIRNFVKLSLSYDNGNDTFYHIYSRQDTIKALKANEQNMIKSEDYINNLNDAKWLEKIYEHRGNKYFDMMRDDTLINFVMPINMPLVFEIFTNSTVCMDNLSSKSQDILNKMVF